MEIFSCYVLPDRKHLPCQGDTGLERDTQITQSDPCNSAGDIQCQELPQDDDSTSLAREIFPNLIKQNFTTVIDSNCISSYRKK